MRTLSLAAAVVAVLFVDGVLSHTVSAHHSFAVFFDDAKSVTVSGSVTAFKFTNPHAIIELTAKNDAGSERAVARRDECGDATAAPRLDEGEPEVRRCGDP